MVRRNKLEVFKLKTYLKGHNFFILDFLSNEINWVLLFPKIHNYTISNRTVQSLQLHQTYTFYWKHQNLKTEYFWGI